MANPSFFDSDSERAVLGAVLIDNSCIEILRPILVPSDFYIQSHQIIWETCLELEHNKAPVDEITITNAMRDSGRQPDPAYLCGLTSVTPSSANVEYYANIVKDKSIKRGVFSKAKNAMVELKEGVISGLEVATNLERDASDIANKAAPQGYVKIGTLIEPAIQRVTLYKKTPGDLRGVTSGFNSIDRILMGIPKEESYLIISARASIGKTAIMMAMAEGMAIRDKIPVGIFSLEMSKNSLTDRSIANVSEIGANKIKSGWIKQSDVETICGAGVELYQAPIFISDVPGMRMSLIRAQSRRMVYADKVKAIFIDHFSLIGTETANMKLPRWQERSIISKELKNLNRELKIPIILLCQLGRGAEGKEPSLADLRETGSLEEDGDIVMFLNRERNQDIDAEVLETDLIIAKNRNGPTGRIKLDYFPKITKFKDKPEGTR